SEAARANTARTEFLANISHELRTPLNAIVGFVELLKDGVYGDLSPRQVPPVDRIAASATHLRHLVDQVLDIAKIAAGRLEVHPETIVLRPFVLNIASELESLVNERGLSFSIAVGAARGRRSPSGCPCTRPIWSRCRSQRPTVPRPRPDRPSNRPSEPPLGTTPRSPIIDF